MSSSELHTLHKDFTDAGGHWSSLLIWHKNSFTLGRSDCQHCFEPVVYCWKQGVKHYWCGARDQSDLWCINKPRLNDLHPTMKPVSLIEHALHNSSRPRDVVLVPLLRGRFHHDRSMPRPIDYQQRSSSGGSPKGFGSYLLNPRAESQNN